MKLIACRKASLSFIRKRCRLHAKLFLIMKLTTILLLTACLQIHAIGLGQNITLSAQNVPLKQVFTEIKRQSGYSFFYEDQLLEKTRPVSVKVKDQPLQVVLNAIFRGQPITYEIVDKVIALKALNDGPGVEAIQPAVAPLPIRISGVIRDDSGTPLEGASVVVKNSSVATISRADGTFEIEVPDANAVLVVSFVGYNRKEVPVGDNRNITVILSKSVVQIENLVVIGYGTQRKRDLTGTITSVKGEEIAKMPNTNPVSSLQGKVAGLTVINTGRAGASPTVRIRGVNSTNNTNPLFVVDGVFQTNIDYLNPADIESIEVLRDPSSIAIFGLQGGNGVIIVTTKRAAKGQTNVSFQSSVGVQKVNNKIDVVDAAGFKKLYSAQLANLNAQAFDYTNYTANTNWQDLIFRDAVINTNSVTISNSGEKSSTLFSLGYNNQQGVLKYDRYQKYIARLNEEIRVTNSIRFGGDVTGFYWNQNSPDVSAFNYALWAAPIVPVQAGPGLYYRMPSFQRGQIANPVARVDQSTDNAVNKGYRVVGNIFGEVKFLKSFTFRSSFYTDLGFNNSRSFTPLPYSYINLGELSNRTDTSYDQTARTSVSQAQAEYRKYQQDHTLTFEKTFGEHRLTAVAGFTTLYQGSTSLSGSRKDTTLNVPADPNYWYLNIVNANNPLTNGGGGGEDSYMSLFGRVNYAFNRKYLVNLSYRRDGSSKFSPANRWGDFGSVGLGWVMSEESFLANVKGIDFLKLRGAWGTVGSALGLASNLYVPGLNTSNTAVFGDNVYTSVTPAYVPDPNLHWEVVRGIDLGVDGRFLHNRLTSEVTLYDRTTKDILTTITLPGTAGNYSYRTNLGTITNRGIEIALGWNDKIGRDFTYSVSANFSYNQNRVKSIGDNFNFEILGNGGVNKTVTGSSIGYFYGYRQIGIYQTVADMDKTPAFANSLPGDIAYDDVNKDGKIDSKDRTYLGTPFPPYNFGFNVSLGYKGFDLLIDGQGVAGNKIYTQRRTQTFAVLNYETNRLDAWTGAGTNNVEPILDNTRANNFLFSSYFLEPGDYFRIRTLQVGYNFSKKILGNSGIKNLRLYISGQNIATFTKATGYTPEVSLSDPIASGADNGTYPVPAIYSVGVNINF
jgi:TonB-linked SusC/RagA family outer membrane protein